MSRRILRPGMSTWLVSAVFAATGSWGSLAGCGDEHVQVTDGDAGAPTRDAGSSDGSSTSASDGSAAVDSGRTCSPDAPFGALSLVANVNTGGTDWCPRLSPSGLDLYVTADIDG